MDTTLTAKMDAIGELSVEDVRNILHRDQVTNLTFIKKDGTVRKMVATLNEFLIPEAATPKGVRGKTQGEVDGELIRVYDTEAEGWRTVTVKKIISIY